MLTEQYKANKVLDIRGSSPDDMHKFHQTGCCYVLQLTNFEANEFCRLPVNWEEEKCREWQNEMAAEAMTIVIKVSLDEVNREYIYKKTNMTEILSKFVRVHLPKGPVMSTKRNLIWFVVFFFLKCASKYLHLRLISEICLYQKVEPMHPSQNCT